MPQKRNPDILELVRAKSAILSAETSKVKGVIRSLPSGYNRDFQETKGPLLRSARLIRIMIDVMDLAFSKLTVDEENLRGAFDPSIFATDAAYDLVKGGMPFRDAYREVASQASTLENRDPGRALESRTSTGTSGNLRLDVAEEGLARLLEENEAEEKRLLEVWERLAGRPVRPA